MKRILTEAHEIIASWAIPTTGERILMRRNGWMIYFNPADPDEGTRENGRLMDRVGPMSVADADTWLSVLGYRRTVRQTWA